MAVNYKAPVKDIVFGYQVINSYDVLSKISQFSNFSEDIVIPTMEECGKFAEDLLLPNWGKSLNQYSFSLFVTYLNG